MMHTKHLTALVILCSFIEYAQNICGMLAHGHQQGLYYSTLALGHILFLPFGVTVMRRGSRLLYNISRLRTQFGNVE
ncbi:hypothetical protein DEU56DRAFT_791763 [Suillus clintonianus]|uniref:uncharacterized protein n=1 Tax=Suillus clintonianus TaxID=1904413 RepID=UPI001B87FD06|nr:uncharacterized protein DEU56DRAFT_791763 [Suillus clintonianus]KAG2143656.1 hypothetical protein DEU56DRAFT_791763 [Suillus clintonianus]